MRELRTGVKDQAIPKQVLFPNSRKDMVLDNPSLRDIGRAGTSGKATGRTE